MKTAVFDPQDWESIEFTYNKINELGVMLTGITESGEFITFGADEEKRLLTTEVLQKNGWVRINYYWLDDHTTEEMYSKEEK